MKKAECKYHNMGSCNRGLSCEFKHMKNEICFRYYNDNYCWKNDSCEFMHINKSEIERNPREMRQEIEEKQAEKTKDLKKINIDKNEGE